MQTLTATTKTGITINIMPTISDVARRGLTIIYIASLNENKCECEIIKSYDKYGNSQGHCARFSDFGKLVESFKGKSGLVKINEQQQVDAFKKQAESILKIEIEKKVSSFLNEERSIKINYGTTSYGLTAWISDTSQSVNDFLKPCLLYAYNNKLIEYALDLDFTFSANAEITIPKLKEIIELLDEVKNKKDNARKVKFDEAAKTNKPVLLYSYSAQEEDTPLKNDDEGDIVTCSVFAMPNGTEETSYSHNY